MSWLIFLYCGIAFIVGIVSGRAFYAAAISSTQKDNEDLIKEIIAVRAAWIESHKKWGEEISSLREEMRGAK